MYILYDKKGNECSFLYGIDVKEALTSGMYFSNNPKKSKRKPEAEAEAAAE